MTEHPAGGTAEAARADPGMRVLRAVAFSAVCVSVSGCAHALASHAGLPWRSLLAGWLVMLCLVTPLAGRERSRPGIIATLLCGQMVLHVVFAVGQCHDAVAGVPDGGMPPAAQAMPGHVAGSGMGASLMPGPAMFALHLAAAAVLGWVVHRGDRALWTLVRVSRRATGTLTAPLRALLGAILAGLPALPVVPAAGATPGVEGVPGEIVLLHHAVIRRGPPSAV
ncbi:hypothetical protein LUW76_20580 [Actinomadura madurae]|uniref:hypothetical protein n=1 Tax=Actinomadura madurae TaxID=1993 RepID=UPI00202736E6|nr:hypothetical protein [Actinomadura madurae]URM96536.1 hypothetical protein LUW76_20580 [Actinomadura madurae]